MNMLNRGALCVAIATLFSAHAVAAPKKPAAKPAAAAAAPVAVKDIELVHTLGADKGAQLQKLVDRYNAAHPQAKVVLHDRAWNEGSLPHLMILGERDLTSFLAGPQRYRPLHQVMKDSGERFETLRAPAMMTPTPIDSADALLVESIKAQQGQIKTLRDENETLKARLAKIEARLDAASPHDKRASR